MTYVKFMPGRAHDATDEPPTRKQSKAQGDKQAAAEHEKARFSKFVPERRAAEPIISTSEPESAEHVDDTPSGKPLLIEPQSRPSQHNATIQEWRAAILALPAANSREADRLVGKALAFLDDEAIDPALDAGWDDVALFGVDAGPDWAGHGAAWGLIPRLSLANFRYGSIAFDGDVATIETSGACVLTHRRFQPARDCATPFWLHDLEA